MILQAPVTSMVYSILQHFLKSTLSSYVGKVDNGRHLGGKALKTLLEAANFIACGMGSHMSAGKLLPLAKL